MRTAAYLVRLIAMALPALHTSYQYEQELVQEVNSQPVASGTRR